MKGFMSRQSKIFGTTLIMSKGPWGYEGLDGVQHVFLIYFLKSFVIYLVERNPLVFFFVFFFSDHSSTCIFGCFLNIFCLAGCT